MRLSGYGERVWTVDNKPNDSIRRGCPYLPFQPFPASRRHRSSHTYIIHEAALFTMLCLRTGVLQ